MRLFKAPQKIDFNEQNVRLFLAGSIDMGSAVNWQTQVIDHLSDLKELGVGVDIYNPRRDDWDSSWVQSKDNPQFREQVEWELNAMELADIICFYFDPSGPAPITLLELGLNQHKEVIVCCPEGYFRKGNVDIVCERYGIAQVDTLQELKDFLHNHVYGMYFDD